MDGGLRVRGVRAVGGATTVGGERGGATKSYRGHDEKLSGAIASAWLALPRGAREKGWPAWSERFGDEQSFADPAAGSR